MKKVIIMFAVVILLCGCAQDDRDGEYEKWYNDGYESGYEEGRAVGQNEVYAELVENGVLRKSEIVWLSTDGSDVYHGYYCQKADQDREVLKEVAKELGCSRCDECGGKGRTVYVPVA